VFLRGVHNMELRARVAHFARREKHASPKSKASGHPDPKSIGRDLSYGVLRGMRKIGPPFCAARATWNCATKNFCVYLRLGWVGPRI